MRGFVLSVVLIVMLGLGVAPALCQTLPAASQPAASQPTTSPAGLPGGVDMEPTSLAVTADGSMAMYRSLRNQGNRAARDLHLVDLKTGQEADLSKLVPDAQEGAFSPNGKRAWILSQLADRMVLSILDLATNKVTKVIEAPSCAPCGSASSWR